MKRMSTPVKIVLGLGAVLIAALLGAGFWAHRNGYVDALRGGMAENDGNLDEAIRHFQRAYEKNPNGYMVAHDVACCYSLKNDRRNALLWLKKALETDHADAVRKSARTDRGFANIRSDSAFKSLIEGGPGSR